MRKLTLVLCTLSLAASVSLATAQDKKPEKKKARPALTQEQKQLRKDILAKYDANKDGKLDREERKKITDADREKLKKAGLGPNRQKSQNRKAKKAHDEGKSKAAHAHDSNPVKTQ